MNRDDHRVSCVPYIIYWEDGKIPFVITKGGKKNEKRKKISRMREANR